MKKQRHWVALISILFLFKTSLATLIKDECVYKNLGPDGDPVLEGSAQTAVERFDHKDILTAQVDSEM